VRIAESGVFASEVYARAISRLVRIGDSKSTPRC
jgi:hypothetical protein